MKVLHERKPSLYSSWLWAVSILMFLGTCWWIKTAAATESAESILGQIPQLQEEIVALAVNQMTGWKTYRNKKYGYEIKYPEVWEIVEAQPRVGIKATWAGNVLLEGELQKVTFLEKESIDWPGEFQIRVLSNPDQLNLEEWVSKHEPQDVTGGSLIQEMSDTTLDGRPAKRLSIFGFDHEGLDIVSPYNGYIYYLSFTGSNPNDAEAERHQQVYDQMLRTFRFIR
jgi:hypothetical protein